MNPATVLRLIAALKKAKGVGGTVAGKLPALAGRSKTALTTASRTATRGAARAAGGVGRAYAGAGAAMGRAGDKMQVPGWMKATAAAGGGLAMADMGLWAIDSLSGEDGALNEKEMRLQLLKASMADAERTQTMQPYHRAIEENKRSLAQRDPTTMKSILAGQRLMDGEEMMGGEPRTDILDQIALQMAMGKFQDTGGEELDF